MLFTLIGILLIDRINAYAEPRLKAAFPNNWRYFYLASLTWILGSSWYLGLW
jgi:hypothetical protein